MSLPAVVVVLHDSARVLPGLLAALPRGVELVCVDTGSHDAGPQLARDAGARVIVLGDNPGFGAANNAGLAVVRAAETLLLNPDTVPRPGAIEALGWFAAERDALHAPRLRNADGTIQDSVHPVPGGLRGLWPVRPAVWTAEREREVGWATGAALAARTATLRALGPFDPDAFMFYEDLELCLHARTRGIPTVLHPSCEVVHLGGHSTAGLDRLALEAARRREVVRAPLGRRALMLDDLGQLLELGLRAPVRTRARAQLAALRAARRAPG